MIFHIQAGINSDALSAILVELAEFHATCHHYLQTYSGGVKQFVTDNPTFKSATIYEEVFREDSIEILFQQTFTTAAQILQMGGHKELAGKVLAQKRVWRQKADSGLKPGEGDFVTLVHGDVWFKNVLIRYNVTGLNIFMVNL